MSMCANHILVPFQAVVICFMAFMLLVAVWRLRRIANDLASVAAPPSLRVTPDESEASFLARHAARSRDIQKLRDDAIRKFASRGPPSGLGDNQYAKTDTDKIMDDIGRSLVEQMSKPREA